MNKRKLNRRNFFYVIVSITLFLLIITITSIKDKQTNTIQMDRLDPVRNVLLLDEESNRVEWGNMVKNPNINYSKDSTTIENWRIDAARDLGHLGISKENAEINLDVQEGFRKLKDFPEYSFGEENPNGVFQSKSVGIKDGKKSFFLIAQRIAVEKDMEYSFIIELSSSSGMSKVDFNVYDGDETTGDKGHIIKESTDISADKRIVILKFKAQSDNVTISIRHNKNEVDNISNGTPIVLNIHVVGVYRTDSEGLENKINKLLDNQSLFKDLDKIDEELIVINENLLKQEDVYSNEVKTALQEKITGIKEKVKKFKSLKEKITDSYKDSDKTSLKDIVNAQYLSDLKNEIEDIKEEGIKGELETKYNEISGIYKKGIVDDITEKAVTAKNKIDTLDISDGDKETHKNNIDDHLGKEKIKLENEENPLRYPIIQEETNQKSEKEFNDALKKQEDNQNERIERIKDIEKEAQDILLKIDYLENLTSTEKNIEKGKINKIKEDSIAQVESEKTVDTIKSKGQEGITNLKSSFLSTVQLNDNSEMDKHLETKKNHINDLTNLSQEDKNKTIASLETVNKDTKEKINLAQTVEDLPSIKQEAKEKMRLVNLSANQLSAENEMEEYLEEQRKYINNLPNLNQDDKNGIIAALERINKDTKEKINLVQAKETLPDIIETAKNKMKEERLLAAKIDATKYVKKAANALNDGVVSEQLQRLLNDEIELLNKQVTLENVQKQKDASYEKIKQHINDEKEAKKNIDLLTSKYTDHKDSGLYKLDALTELTNIYLKAKEDIKENPKKSSEILQKAIDDFLNIKVFEVTTGDFEYENIQLQKPTDATIVAGIKNSEGLRVGTKIKIEKLALKELDINSITNLIKKQHNVIVENSNFINKYEISIMNQDDVKITNLKGIYEVKILLKNRLENNKIPRAIYKNGDELEILEGTYGENWITFKTTQFGDFYLLDDISKSPNYSLIIILLSVIILLEIGIILIKKKRSKSNQQN